MNTLTGKKKSLHKQLILDLYQKIDYLSNNPLNDPLEEHEQIEQFLDKIIALEKDISSTLPRRENKWPQFIRWCNDNGVATNGFAVKKLAVTEGCEDCDEYGLFSTSRFACNDVILRVPRKLFLTNESALLDPKFDIFVKDPLFAHMPNLLLAFRLLAEFEKPNSFWAPYLQTLPSAYRTVLYMTHAELQQLRGSPLLEEAIKVKRNVARQYAYFAMKLEVINSTQKRKNPLSVFNYELYRWALSTVMTRQNSVPCAANDAKWTLALIPLWDLCNHRNGNLCTDFDKENDSLVFYSMNDLDAGEEIVNYYGNRSNGDFFLHNGFVYEDHARDSMRIKIGLAASDPLFALKETLCKKIDIVGTNGTFEVARKSAPINADLLAFIRIFLLDRDQLMKWIDADDSKSQLREKENCAADLRALDDRVSQFLSTRCTLLLRKYGPVERFLHPNIEKIVRCEKSILQSYLPERA